jgi:hypothetical protein
MLYKKGGDIRANPEVDMIIKKITGTLTLLLLLAGDPVSSTATRDSVDHSIYGRLLQAHINQGRVDYHGFKNDEAQLDAYLATLAAVNPATLERREQMAFYINLYNAWTIKLILGAWPDLKSIKDVGGLFQSPWKKSFVRLGKRVVTLDHIEHDILRPRFKDPRVHFAINCASISCPPLLNAPFTGSRLEDQLERITTDFINDPGSNYIKGDVLYVSKIFKWFAEDFNGDPIGFFKRYARMELKTKLDSGSGRLDIKYLPYDWGLNSV